MFDYDFTFCMHEECDDTTCFRHRSHMPVNTPISVADLYGTLACQRYGETSTLTELTQRIEALSLRDGDILWCAYDEHEVDGDTAVDLYKYIRGIVGDNVPVLFIPNTISISQEHADAARAFAHRILYLIGDE